MAKATPDFEFFGLPPHLHFPIAATSLAAIRAYVGSAQAVEGHPIQDGVVVTPDIAAQTAKVDPRWAKTLKARYEVLARGRQVWVRPHASVKYRELYRAAGFRDPGARFLDHVMNWRNMANVLGYVYLRLVPVSSGVNSNAGNASGGEVRLALTADGGYERDTSDLTEQMRLPARKRVLERPPVVYADPFDLTKMFNERPGTVPAGLSGVPRMLRRLGV
jgi:hypothetical protein